MKTLTIASRFCGPAASSNGGYFAGLVATLASRTLAVRLLKPPPLDTELAVTDLQDGSLQVMHGEEPIGEARTAVLTLDAKPPPDYLEAVEASRRYAGFRYHRFPTCFVCGTRGRPAHFRGPDTGAWGGRGALGSRRIARSR